MSRKETVILTNMCMVTDGQGNVLMQDRNDAYWPGLVFPGGHVEPNESITDSVIREVREETGLTVIRPTLCGVKQFWTDEGNRYLVFLFRASKYEGTLQSSDEGEALWLPREGLLKRHCVHRFEDLLRIFENDTLSEVYYPNETPYFL